VSYDEALAVLPRSDAAAVASFAECLLRRDGRTALAVIDDCLEAGVDVDQFAGDVVELLRKVLIAKVGGDVEQAAFDMSAEQKAKLNEWRGLRDASELVRLLELLMEKRRDIRTSQPPQLPLEIAVAKYCETPSMQASPDEPPERAAAKAGAAGPERSGASRRTPPKEVSAAARQEPDPAEAGKERVAHAAASEAIEAAATPTVTKTGAEAGPASSAPPVLGVSIEKLKSLWNELLRLVGEENHSLPFLLGTAEPVGVEGDLVKVGFNYAFHRDKLNHEKNRRILEKALGCLLKTAVRVEGVVLDRKVGIVNNGAAPETVSAAPLTPVDGLAAAFGGRVVE